MFYFFFAYSKCSFSDMDDSILRFPGLLFSECTRKISQMKIRE